jgi:hypothetical protein
MKNLYLKKRDKDAPYEVWANNDGWRWRVLKPSPSWEKTSAR